MKNKILTLILFTIFTVNNANAKPIKTFQTTLDNGLKLIVLEDKHAPIVTHMLWFYIGATDDPIGKSGLAHYLEHMMFKGSRNVANGEYSKQIEAFGGKYNAFTGRDFTAYYVVAAKENLHKIMELEADRMRHLTPQKFENELEIIQEERRSRIDNNPNAKLEEAVNSAMFRHHPYRIPIIGWKHEMKDLKRTDVMRFYHKYYHPANAVLLLVGDISPIEAKRLANKYYGNWRRKGKYRSTWVEEPPFEASHIVILKDEKVNIPAWSRTYFAPNIINDDAFPLMLLKELLTAKNNSYLYKYFVEDKGLATAISASYDSFNIGSGKFSFYITPTKNISLNKISTEFDKALAKAFENILKQKTYSRAKNLLKAQTIYAREDVENMAFIIGKLIMLGLNEDIFNDWSNRIEKINSEKLEEVMKIFDKPYVEGHLLPINK